MRVQTSAWILVPILGWLCVQFDAAAQQAPAYPAGYREAFDEALKEYEHGNFPESRSLFERAHGLFPNASTHWGLGSVAFELRNYGECIDQLEAALSSSVRPLKAEIRAQTEIVLARARNFVARVNLEIEPAVAQVVIDGVPVQLRPGKALVLEVGDHVLEARAVSFEAEKRELQIRSGRDQHLHIVLRPKPAPQTRKPWYKSPWLWTAVGVAAAGASTGAAVAATRNDEKPAPLYGGSSGSVVTAP